MLTSDLVRARVRGKTIEPTWIDTSRGDLREPAETMVDIVRQAVDEGWSQGDLVEALDGATATHRSHKVLRGLRKLLLDRCDFEVDAPLPPVELRRRVFLKAREMGPLDLAHGALDRTTAADVLQAVATELDVTVEAVDRALYGDLKDAQVLASFRDIGVDELLQRYNVALVQALLLKSVQVRIELEGPSVPRVRQLLRYAKFHQLVHRAHRKGEMLTLELDGPTSMFSQSTRYGLQLAIFFPALLLQDVPWRMEADVLWTKARHRKTLEVTHTQGLVSHYADTGAYVPREVAWFAERWEATGSDSGWKMTDDTAPIELGGRGVVLPDFTFKKGRKTAHLEIVGFWRKAWLERRLEGLRRHGPGNLVLAVSKKLAVGQKEALDDTPVEVIAFSQVVPVKSVLEALDKVAR